MTRRAPAARFRPARRARPRPRAHPESLVRIPLVRQMLDDRQTRLVPRAIDDGWHQDKLCQIRTVGFNPAHGAIYYPNRSRFARWLADPYSTARRYNESDFLVRDVLQSVHDYLHAWAYLAIGELAPEIGFGTRPITRDNIEDFVFCHLATEAAAVVGLDYWYLATVHLNEVCPIGTQVNKLAVAYHEDHLPEYRRFNRRFRVQRRQFFTELATFYMEGLFVGFDLGDVRQSALLLGWLRHELEYGVSQRRYTRQWFQHLSAEDIAYTEAQLAAPVAADARWQRRLLDGLGRLLWDKVKADELHRFSFRLDPGAVWRSPEGRPPDFRFLNANRFRGRDVGAIQRSGPEADASFDHFVDQFISQHVYDRSDDDLHRLLTTIRTTRNAQVLARVFRGVELVPMRKAEPLDLFFLN